MFYISREKKPFFHILILIYFQLSFCPDLLIASTDNGSSIDLSIKLKEEGEWR